MLGGQDYLARPHAYTTEVSQSFVDTKGSGVFITAFPRNSLIKDIILYRPYTSGEELKVEFFNDTSENELTKEGLLTNKLHTINLPVSGMVICAVYSDSVEKIFVIYELL